MDPRTRRRLAVGLLAALALVAAAPQVRAQEAFFSSLEIEGDGMRTYAHGLSGNGAVPVGIGIRKAKKFWPVRLTEGATYQKLSSEGLGFGGEDASFTGDVVVGSDAGGVFRWTGAGGSIGLGVLPGDTSSQVGGVSADGGVLVGLSFNSITADLHAFRWTEPSGMQDLGTLPNAAAGSATAEGVSADGEIVVGWAVDEAGEMVAFRWTEAAGMQSLGIPVQGGLAVSADGTVIVGSGRGRDAGFIWSEASGTQLLGGLPGGSESGSPRDVSASGSVVVGMAENAKGWHAVAWTDPDSPQRIKKLLRDALSKKDFRRDVEGWRLTRPTGISDDGATIVGIGENPDGKSRSWIAHLPELALDEPIPPTP